MTRNNGQHFKTDVGISPVSDKNIEEKVPINLKYINSASREKIIDHFSEFDK